MTEYEKEIQTAREWAMDMGISDGTRPNDPVTRAEVWVMLHRLEGGETK